MTLSKSVLFLRSNSRVLIACLVVILGLFGHGAVSGYTSPAIPNINERGNSPFRLNDHESSWVASINGISSVMGLFFTGYLMDTFGRKLAILLASVPFVIGLAILTTAHTVNVLLVGQFFAGLCLGLIQAIIYVYMSETAPSNIRGMVLSFGTVSFSSGVLAVYVVGSFLRWTWLAVFCSSFFTLLVCLMVFLPETPRWYVMKGFKEGAHDSLQWFRGGGSVGNGSASADMIHKELEEIQKSATDTITWREFFVSTEYRRPLFTTVAINTVLQFTGCGVTRQFMIYIFRLAGEAINPHTQTIIAAGVSVFGNFVCLLTVDLLGRRLLLIIASCLMAVATALIGVYFKMQAVDRLYAQSTFHWLPLFAMCLFNFSFSAGCDPVRYILFTEHFPTRARGKGMGVTCIAGELFRFATLKFFVQMNAFMYVYGTFWFYSAACLLQAGLAVAILKETTGRALD